MRFRGQLMLFRRTALSLRTNCKVWCS